MYFDKVKMITITTCADMFPNVNRQSWFETINFVDSCLDDRIAKSAPG